jgi:biotin synthase-related radical SAM superfamily protein
MNFIHKFSNNCEFCGVAKSVESDYQLYLKNLFKKKRTAATHVLVIAIQYTEPKLLCGNYPIVRNYIYSNGDL